MGHEWDNWRASAAVMEFLANAEPREGGLLRFEDVSPERLRDLLATAPSDVLQQSADEGPPLANLVDLAAKLGANLSGYASTIDRDDAVFYCDALLLPVGTQATVLEGNDPSDVIKTHDGRIRVWWD